MSFQCAIVTFVGGEAKEKVVVLGGTYHKVNPTPPGRCGTTFCCGKFSFA